MLIKNQVLTGFILSIITILSLFFISCESEFIECGGILGDTCPEGLMCIDNPNDECLPEDGGACPGICVDEDLLIAPIIEDIEYSEVYNSILGNLLINYWDGQGDFENKESGLWLGDWMGDSGSYAIDSLLRIAYDDRLLQGSEEDTRLVKRQELIEKTNKTVKYSIFCGTKLLNFFLGGEEPSQAVMFSALGGYPGIGAAYELMGDPLYKLYAQIEYAPLLVRPSYYTVSASETTLAIQLVKNNPGLLEEFYFSPIMAGGMAVLSAAGNACANRSNLILHKIDLDLALQMLDHLDDKYWDDTNGRYKDSSLIFDHPTIVRSLVKLYKATLENKYLEKARGIGELIHETNIPYNAYYLSYAISPAIAFLELYGATGDGVYLNRVRLIIERINETLIVEDPYFSERSLAAHDIYRADLVKSGAWPEYDPENPEWAGCTGCNHLFCDIIYRYDGYLRSE